MEQTEFLKRIIELQEQQAAAFKEMANSMTEIKEALADVADTYYEASFRKTVPQTLKEGVSKMDIDEFEERMRNG